MGLKPSILKIAEFPVSSSNDSWRFEAKIGNSSIFFESDVPIVASTEAVISSFLFPAMFAGIDISADGPVCRKWLKNNRVVRDIARDWWHFRDIEIQARGEEKSPRSKTTGLFFTGGVDSFYSLLSNVDQIDTLIFVEGFDIPLSDTDRLTSTKNLCLEIANSLGKKFVTIRTDLRSHPAFNSLNWGMLHGAALATIGHILGRELGEVRIATSDVPPPHGSHPLLDKWWSSGTVEFVSDGIDVRRLQKVMTISDNPLVHDHLRVCWEKRGEKLNCGECEKCVRTQAQFAAAGALNRLEIFPKGGLTDRINQIASIPIHLVDQWKHIVQQLPQSPEKSAADDLIKRTSPPKKGFSLRRYINNEKRNYKKRKRIVESAIA